VSLLEAYGALTLAFAVICIIPEYAALAISTLNSNSLTVLTKALHFAY